jgi:hypothetical protein
MSAAIVFRANADRQRLAASEETLANRREMHERSALMRDAMAEKIEATEQLAVVNAKAKAAERAAQKS